MQQKSIDFFSRNFANEQMNFLYTGNFSDLHTDHFIELNSQQVENVDGSKMLQRKAAFLIAECFQNVVRHSDLTNKEAYFHIKNNFGVFSLTSGNTIQNNIVSALKGQLEQLNKLTSEELREVYRQTLEDTSFSNKGGAGLGLIEMARKTKNKLSFRFSRINAIKSYFYFQLLLNSTSTNRHVAKGNFDADILLKSRMVKDDLFLVYKGIISSNVTSSLLRIVEGTFQSQNQKFGFVELMGLIENFTKALNSVNSDSSMMLLMGKNEVGYKIETSCMASNLTAKKLSRSLNLYKTFSPECLENEQLDLLSNPNQGFQNNYKLNLVELIKNCVDVKVNFEAYNETHSFIGISAYFYQNEQDTLLTFKQIKNLTTS
jgi:hypothetical protein